MDGGAWWAAVHGVAKSWTRLSDFPFTFHFHALEKQMATHSSVLAWRIPGTGEPGGLPSLGSHRVGHDWSDLAAAAAAASQQVMQGRYYCTHPLSQVEGKQLAQDKQLEYGRAGIWSHTFNTTWWYLSLPVLHTQWKSDRIFFSLLYGKQLLNAWLALFSTVLTTFLERKCCHQFHFLNEESETQRSELAWGYAANKWLESPFYFAAFL